VFFRVVADIADYFSALYIDHSTEKLSTLLPTTWKNDQRCRQSWAYCAEERKSASPQAFFTCAATQLRSLSFKILGATFNRNFYQ
jgi:hypothetical protein